MLCINSILDTSQPLTGWLNDAAPWNMLVASVTLDMSQPLTGWLNDVALANMLLI